MNSLNKDIILRLVCLLDIDSLSKLTFLDKYFYFSLQEFYSLKIKKKIKFIKEYFCYEVIQLLGGMENLLIILFYLSKIVFRAYQLFGWYNSKRYVASYYDRYRFLLKGYICIRTRFKNCKPVVNTMFQRYSYPKDTWTNGCCGYGFIFESSYFLRNGQMKHHLLTSNLYNIINNINYIHCFKNWSHLETVKKIYLE